MPYLFEGVRLYRGEQDGVQYLSCETLSLLDPDQMPNLGILQRFIAPSAPISLPADEKRTLLTKSLGVEVKKLGDMKEL